MKVISWIITWRWVFKQSVMESQWTEQGAINMKTSILRNNLFGCRNSAFILRDMQRMIDAAAKKNRGE
ncbi:hypothetical protein M2010_003260 [Providencia stuartii]|uniref:hypothetical protein n=1 Tax=Providencia stuartii TaxID=588 RepID=UPI0018A71D0F|nr:hypothetical protein [Providencia stuartii]MDT7051884.1 hypothetical protein [Providencia stuartii]HEM8877750.1 hypothetical protein [Providencia stuartii]